MYLLVVDSEYLWQTEDSASADPLASPSLHPDWTSQVVRLVVPSGLHKYPDHGRVRLMKARQRHRIGARLSAHYLAV